MTHLPPPRGRPETSSSIKQTVLGSPSDAECDCGIPEQGSPFDLPIQPTDPDTRPREEQTIAHVTQQMARLHHDNHTPPSSAAQGAGQGN